MPDKDTWSLIKETAETQEERLRHADMELNSLKNEQVIYDKTLGTFVDGFGKKYSRNQADEQNSLVRIKALVIVKENKIKDPNYLEKFMFSKDRKWKKKENVEYKDLPATQLPQEKSIRKIFTAQRELKLPTPEENPIIQKQTKQEPSIQEIINQRISIKNQTSGIGTLRNKRTFSDDGLENENFLNGHGLHKPKGDI